MARLEIVRDEVEVGRRERGRPISLRLDGRAWLRVSPAELAELGVADGEEVTETRSAALQRGLERTRARAFVVRSLAARAQSVAEVEAKLAARGIPADLAAEAVELARGYGYLDDAVLAGQLARGHRSRGYGRRRAERALRARGLPAAVAETALDEAYAADAETSDALAALGRRSFGEGDAGRRKAAGFLIRRGFSPAAAWAAVRMRADPTSGAPLPPPAQHGDAP